MKKLVLIVGVVLSGVFVFYVRSHQEQQGVADVVIFSFNRPLQLFSLLESMQKYMTGINETHVVFRAGTDQFLKGYEIVKEQFPTIIFHQQGSDPSADFKPLTLKAAFESPAEYLLFAVDDIVVKDAVALAECTQALEKHDAYCFYLRLGKNTHYCYAMDRSQGVPSLNKESNAIYSWQLGQSSFDWAYPHTVDMSLFRKRDIEGDLRTLSYNAPNRLEGAWVSTARRVMRRKALCFDQSKIVNLPLNLVQEYCKNRVMHEYSAEQLLEKFLEGYKMDITPLRCVANNAAHMEYSPTFITR